MQKSPKCGLGTFSIISSKHLLFFQKTIFIRNENYMLDLAVHAAGNYFSPREALHLWIYGHFAAPAAPIKDPSIRGGLCPPPRWGGFRFGGGVFGFRRQGVGSWISLVWKVGVPRPSMFLYAVRSALLMLSLIHI